MGGVGVAASIGWTLHQDAWIVVAFAIVFGIWGGQSGAHIFMLGEAAFAEAVDLDQMREV